ncbi:MAG: sugar phosphate nucleotidyltransferase [Chloroflexota bacterium]|nr:sugar phosphate nucleotidyltransferase [Chloroflexota bacterium]MDE2898979.1 sugar phosphate nucleotidyltransferase [Chloroflexota bacterium]
MKGVILAGGTGSRLDPITRVTNKQLLPVYDKPMIFYPIEALVNAGVTEILIVTSGPSAGDFLRLLGNGEALGVTHLNYTYQEGAGGIAEAISLAQPFVGDDRMVVILGDNVIGGNIVEPARRFAAQSRGAKVLLKQVENPTAYGVAELKGDRVVRFVEKPENPPSDLAVTGIYFYDAHAFSLIEQLERSDRGELEVTDLNNAYLERGEMSHDVLEGYWADCGESIDHYLQACNLVATHGANRTG